VAGTYVVELPATLLILAPFRPARLAAAALQVLLQVGPTSREACSVPANWLAAPLASSFCRAGGCRPGRKHSVGRAVQGDSRLAPAPAPAPGQSGRPAPLLCTQANIIVTGNYNYFNVLTAVLCVSLLDDQLLAGLPLVGTAATLQRVQAKCRPQGSPQALACIARESARLPACALCTSRAERCRAPPQVGRLLAAGGASPAAAAIPPAPVQPAAEAPAPTDSAQAGSSSSSSGGGGGAQAPKPAKRGLLQQLHRLARGPYMLADSFPTLTLLLCLAPVAWATAAMFRLVPKAGGGTDLLLAMTPQQLQLWVDWLLPRTLATWGAVLAAAVLQDVALVLAGLFAPPARRQGAGAPARVQQLAGHAAQVLVLLLWASTTGAAVLGTYLAGAPSIAGLSPDTVAKQVR
jgi:hypothetical protein